MRFGDKMCFCFFWSLLPNQAEWMAAQMDEQAAAGLEDGEEGGVRLLKNRQ